MSKRTFKAPICSHDLRAHTSCRYQVGAAWSGARETGLGVLLDTKYFFFFKEQKYKASCQQPLPLGTLVLNCSIHEQRCLGGRNPTPLSPGSRAVSTGCTGGRAWGGLVTGNQTLVELGCRVMTAATFSSLITGDPSSHLGATL